MPNSIFRIPSNWKISMKLLQQRKDIPVCGLLFIHKGVPMKSMISPSMMCVDFKHLEDNVKLLTQLEVEYLHFDIMNGEFVPNYTLGPDFMRVVRSISDIPFDIHLM